MFIIGRHCRVLKLNFECGCEDETGNGLKRRDIAPYLCKATEGQSAGDVGRGPSKAKERKLNSNKSAAARPKMPHQQSIDGNKVPVALRGKLPDIVPTLLS